MKKFIAILAVIILLVATIYLGYKFMNGRIPWTNLKVITLSEEETKTISKRFDYTIWPSNENIFPFYSLNKIFYVTISPSNRRKAEVLNIYKTNSNKLIGSYSFRQLAIYGWESDNSSLYIADREYEQGSIFLLFSSSGYYGPLKKIILPKD